MLGKIFSLLLKNIIEEEFSLSPFYLKQKYNFLNIPQILHRLFLIKQKSEFSMLEYLQKKFVNKRLEFGYTVVSQKTKNYNTYKKDKFVIECINKEKYIIFTDDDEKDYSSENIKGKLVLCTKENKSSLIEVFEDDITDVIYKNERYYFVLKDKKEVQI